MASYLGLEKNISYHTVPVALFFALLPRAYSGLTGPGKKYFDGNNPRLFSAQLSKADLDKRLIGRLQRAEAACSNAFETLGYYAAAIAAGNAAGVSTDILNTVSLTYLVTRLLYTWVYIWGQENRKFILVRTNVWGINMIAITSLFVFAGLQES